MAVLGVASVAPAFPRVAQALDLSTQKVGWLITVFTLPGVGVAPLLGVLADRLGRRTVLLPSLLIFAVAGAGCAFAPDFRWLLILRFLQGLGAAPLGSLNATLIGDLYEGRQRVTAMGYNAAVLSVGTAGYPLIGGLLAEGSWRWPFFLPLLALPVALAAARTLPAGHPDGAPGLLDYMGTLRRAFDRRLLALMAASLLTFVVLYGSYLTYFPFLMDGRFSASPAIIGLVMSTTSVATAVVSLRLGALSGRFGSFALLIGAYLCYIASMVTAPLAPSILLLIGPSLLFGVGNGLNIPTLQSELAGGVRHDVRGAVMAVNGMALRAGQTIGPLVAGVAFTAAGLTGVFALGVGVGVALMVVAFLFLRR